MLRSACACASECILNLLKAFYYVDISIESKYITSYLIAIVMLFISVTISKIFAVEMYMTLTLNVKKGRGKMYTCKSKATT